MPKFRATTNLPGLRAGKTVEGNASDPAIAARLRAGTLVPVDAPAAPAAPVAAAPVSVPAPVADDTDDGADKNRGRKS